MTLRRLHLLRHAKAERGAPGQADFDRHLNKRGSNEAERMARFIADAGIRPDLVLCSASARTVETLAPLRPSLPESCVLRVEHHLYDAMPGDLLDVIRKIADDPLEILCIGHNPTMQMLARGLGPESEGTSWSMALLRFPPCTLASVEFADLPWVEIGARTGELRRCLTPADIP